MEATPAPPLSAKQQKCVNPINKDGQKADNKGASIQDLPSTIFPGACADDSLAEVEDCAIAAARCVACLKMNAFDDLDLNCDRADDQNVNESCPPAAP